MVQKICFKCNGQCSINIPKSKIEEVKWKKGNKISISKIPGKNILLIENVSND